MEDVKWVPTMLAGAGSGAISRVFCHPIETVKSQVQVVQTKTGLTAMAWKIWQREGIRGFYGGFPMVFVMGAPGACLYFTTYELCKAKLEGLPELNLTVAHLTSGLVAEAAACLIFTPVDVTKERLQVQSVSGQPNRYRSSLHCGRMIVAEEGIRGLYKGYGATLASFGPFSAIYLTSYEKYKNLAHRLWFDSKNQGPAGMAGRELPLPLYIIGAAGAGSFAAFVTNPLDLAKLRIQVQSPKSDFHFKYTNIAQGLREIWTKEGVRGLFKGAGGRVVFQAPMTAISMSTFETVKSFFNKVLYTQ